MIGKKETLKKYKQKKQQQDNNYEQFHLTLIFVTS